MIHNHTNWCHWEKDEFPLEFCQGFFLRSAPGVFPLPLLPLACSLPKSTPRSGQFLLSLCYRSNEIKCHVPGTTEYDVLLQVWIYLKGPTWPVMFMEAVAFRTFFSHFWYSFSIQFSFWSVKLKVADDPGWVSLDFWHYSPYNISQNINSALTFMINWMGPWICAAHTNCWCWWTSWAHWRCTLLLFVDDIST